MREEIVELNQRLRTSQAINENLNLRLSAI